MSQHAKAEKVGGSCKVAIPGLDPGIPAGMTTEVLPCVFIIPADISADR